MRRLHTASGLRSFSRSIPVGPPVTGLPKPTARAALHNLGGGHVAGAGQTLVASVYVCHPPPIPSNRIVPSQSRRTPKSHASKNSFRMSTDRECTYLLSPIGKYNPNGTSGVNIIMISVDFGCNKPAPVAVFALYRIFGITVLCKK